MDEIHKGLVVFAIEIINTHEPDWKKYAHKLNYNVYLVRAIDILKRVESTPVYVYCILGQNNYWR